MLEGDEAARALGIEAVEVGEGRATVRMAVRPDMANVHGTCHGGLLFTLADTAFQLACNSYGPVTVAAGAAIEFLAPARPGAVLTARCTELAKHGRSGLYDVVVVDAGGVTVAVFRGRSRTVGG